MDCFCIEAQTCCVLALLDSYKDNYGCFIAKFWSSRYFIQQPMIILIRKKQLKILSYKISKRLKKLIIFYILNRNALKQCCLQLALYQ